MSRGDDREHGIEGMTTDEWLCAYRAAMARGDWPPGAYCSLAPEDWRDDGHEAVYMPMPSVVLGYGRDGER